MRSILLVAVCALAAGCSRSSSPPTPASETPGAIATATVTVTAPPKVYDLSTPKKRAEAAMEAAGLTAVGDCVHELPELSGVVLVGFSGHSGCVARGYFANGVYVKERDDARPALGAAWEDRAKREALARLWLSKALDLELTNKDGAATPAVTAADGSLVFEGYDALPIQSGGFFHRLRVTVSPDAKVTTEFLEKWLEPSKLH